MCWNILSTKSVIILGACTCVLLFITNTFVVRDSASFQMTVQTRELLLDYCHLPNLDPWAPDLKKYINSRYDPLKSCKVEFTPLTNVVNNTIIIHPDLEKQNCSYRCVLRKNDTENTFGNWKLLLNGSRPHCDIVHIECRDVDNNVIYEYLHALIYRNEKVLPPLDSHDMPSVHILLTKK